MSDSAQYVKIDDETFNRISTEIQQIDAAALGEQFEGACRQALAVAHQIRRAASAGVGRAVAIEAVILSSEVFADPARATAFFQALQAARTD
jgi:hypothetical protein